MTSSNGPRISMMSDPGTIDEIALILESAGLPVVVRRPVDDPGRLAFDLGTVEALITIATGLFFTGPVIPAIWKWLHSDSERVLVVDGTARRIEVTGGPELTQEQLLSLVNMAMGRKDPS